MEQISLNVEKRTTTGKGPARQLRMQNKIPAVMYGTGTNESLTVDTKTLTRHLLTEGGKNKLYVLKGEGLKEAYTLIKDYQVDPVTRVLKHVDLLEVDVTKKIEVKVGLTVVGRAPGVVEGGILNVVEREITISVLPNKIPQSIDVDVSGLAIGDSVHIEELSVPEGVEKIYSQNIALVAVVPPAKEEEATPSTEEAAAPEVITAKATDDGDAKKEDKKG